MLWHAHPSGIVVHLFFMQCTLPAKVPAALLQLLCGHQPPVDTFVLSEAPASIA